MPFPEFSTITIIERQINVSHRQLNSRYREWYDRDDTVKATRESVNTSVRATDRSYTGSAAQNLKNNGDKPHNELTMKGITYYDEKHNQAISIDLTIPHDNKLPHKHLYLDHTTAYDVSDDEQELINKIRKEYKLK